MQIHSRQVIVGWIMCMCMLTRCFIQDLIDLPHPQLSRDTKEQLKKVQKSNDARSLPPSVPNPSLKPLPAFNNTIHPGVPIGHR